MKFNALYGRISGVAEVQRDQLVFTSDVGADELTLNIRRMEATLEGINTQHYYFFDPYKPDQRICIQDPKVLELLAIRGSSVAKKILDNSKSKKLKWTALYSTPVLLVVFLVVVIPLTISFIPIKWLDFLITQEREQMLADWMQPVLKTQFQVKENHPAEPLLRQIVDILQKANYELQPVKLKIHLSDSADVNAFATPGNMIIVNRGLIEKASSLEEVAGVIAHELGHVEQKHVVRRVTGQLGAFAGTMILGIFIGFDAAGAIARVNDFVSLRYSRDDELAADRRGAHFLNLAGYSHKGMVSFFEKLASQQKRPGVMAFVSTHPASEERARILESIDAEKFEGAKWPLTFDELKAALMTPEVQ
jgi:beta-barrel assembly-enhancing protease